MILVLAPWSAFSQNDSVSYVRSYEETTLGQSLGSDLEMDFIDTTLDELINYYPDLYQEQIWLGNYGAPGMSMTLGNSNELGLEGRFDQLQSYRLNSEDGLMMNVSQPFTQAEYVLGTQQEERLRLIHSQQIKKGFNLTAELRRVSFQGWFERRKTVHNGARLSGYIAPDSSRYSAMFSAVYHNTYVEENGGFPQLNELVGINPNLSSARNTSTVQDIGFRQIFRLGQKPTRDTSDTAQMAMVEPLSKSWLQHDINFKRGFYIFIDENPDSTHYGIRSIALISDEVKDKWDVLSLTNQLSWVAKKEKSFLKIFGMHKFYRFQQGTDFFNLNDFNDFIVGGEFALSSEKFGFSGSGAYTVGGITFGDLRLKAKVQGKLKDSFTAFATGAFDLYEPDFLYREYRSAELSWTSNLNKSSWTDIKGGIKTQNGGELSISFLNLTNITYFDSLLVIGQDGATGIVVRGQHRFDLGKFHLTPKVVYQSMSASDAIRFPKIQASLDAYYQGKWFNQKMDARLGTRVVWFSSYEPFSYMPLIRSFNTQQGFTSGEYPFVEAYGAFKVKTLRFFAKATNLYYFNIPGDYFLIEEYPLNPFAVKIGFNWMFES